MSAVGQPFAQAFGRVRDRFGRGDAARVESEFGGACA
jgi:hypothetical protein